MQRVPKWLKTLRSVPVVQQVSLVGNAPFFHDGGYFAWQLALKHLASLHGHQGFKTLVFSVDVDCGGWSSCHMRMMMPKKLEMVGMNKFYALPSQSPRLSASARRAVCKGMNFASASLSSSSTRCRLRLPARARPATFICQNNCRIRQRRQSLSRRLLN